MHATGAPASSSLVDVLDKVECHPAKALGCLSCARGLDMIFEDIKNVQPLSLLSLNLRETKVCHVTHTLSHKHVPGTLNLRLMMETTGDP